MSSVSLPGPSTVGPRVVSVRERVRNYLYVLYALMMHDIKNRFFGSGLGQIVMVLWPFVHILVLIGIYVFTRRPNPYGSSIVQYSAVSIFPFICFNYVARWIVYSALTNKTFLQYPIIKPLDLMIARALLEIVSITLVAILLVLFVVGLGYDAMPSAPDQAIYCACATAFLAIGLGFLNGAIAFIFPLWSLAMVVIIIGMYISSGIVFLPTQMPEQIRFYLSYNPLLNCVEWMRSAYYSDYPTSMIDKTYVLEFGLISLALGIILERLLRRML